MSERFSPCLDCVLELEKGFVHDPRDSGGATNMGITKFTLAEYRGKPVSVEDVRQLSLDEARTIYRQNYWNPIKGDSLPVGVDLMVFDTAVNMGVSTAVRMLQKALNVVVDGALGPKTLAAASGRDRTDLLIELSAQRMLIYTSLSTWRVYSLGWTRRLMKIFARAQG